MTIVWLRDDEHLRGVAVKVFRTNRHSHHIDILLCLIWSTTRVVSDCNQCSTLVVLMQS